jgi:glycosyltransferase involved in cell wall biosynthesis
MESTDIRLFLVAPNVSAQMGGEAIKALQIFEELQALIGNVIQITHIRNQFELSKHRLASHIEFLDDDWVDGLLWRSVVLRVFMTPWFSYRAVKRAERLAAQAQDGRTVIIHQTEPNSPVATRWTSAQFANVFGPINGNIYYPKSFRRFESPGAKIRRLLHFPSQYLNRLFWRGISNADLILAAGGDRTTRSLIAAGVTPTKIYQTLDCGIPDSLCQREPGVRRVSSNGRFIHFGRLVFHKGTFLAIQAVAKSQPNVTLDVVGRGPELARCRALVNDLGVEDRVRFVDWYENREDLVSSFKNYSGVILPSIEDANGIVVQEAMAAGLVPVCLDWGGPQLLIEDAVSGYLIKPDVFEEIAPAIARCLDRLATDSKLAEEMSAQARQRATQWRWSQLAKDWVAQYMEIAA